MRGPRITLLALVGAFGLAGCAAETAEPLEVGDCLIISSVGTSGDSVPTVACDQPHEAEVYATVSVTDAADYDEDAVIDQVEALCMERFAAYTGEDYSTSPLDIFYTWPLADGWEAGDRSATCAVFVPDDAGAPVAFEGTLAAS